MSIYLGAGLKRLTFGNQKYTFMIPEYGYVSLGDSIAAGHAIDDNWEKKYGTRSQYGENGNLSTRIVTGSYTDRIRKELAEKYGSSVVTTTSFAHSGDTVADLINKLSRTEVVNAIKRAKLVTVCIGANDVLGVAIPYIEPYINTGDLGPLEVSVEKNLSVLNTDSNATSYVSLFNRLNTINPKAKYVFTTIYNPYKYLWLDEGRNGFFGPMLNTIPEMNLDIDKIIEDMFFNGNNLVYYDVTKLEWVSIDLELGLGGLIKDGLLSTPIVQLLFDRVNGLGDWSEKYVEGNSSFNGLNKVLRNKINSYKSTHPNFVLADTKPIFDTYPDRPVSADVHYNDLVNVEFTRGYTTATMDWGALWRDTYGESAAGITQYWTDLAWKHLSWNNGFPSLNVGDYVSFNLNGFAEDLVQQTIEKVIMPNVDPHPEVYGHVVLKQSFASALNNIL